MSVRGQVVLGVAAADFYLSPAPRANIVHRSPHPTHVRRCFYFGNSTMLPVQDTIDTWRQWYYTWDATPGTHVLQVRATDKSGYTQTVIKHKAPPNGASGYHTIHVNVA